jgi:hypothetical protein
MTVAFTLAARRTSNHLPTPSRVQNSPNGAAQRQPGARAPGTTAKIFNKSRRDDARFGGVSTPTPSWHGRRRSDTGTPVPCTVRRPYGTCTCRCPAFPGLPPRAGVAPPLTGLSLVHSTWPLGSTGSALSTNEGFRHRAIADRFRTTRRASPSPNDKPLRHRRGLSAIHHNGGRLSLRSADLPTSDCSTPCGSRLRSTAGSTG